MVPARAAVSVRDCIGFSLRVTVVEREGGVQPVSPVTAATHVPAVPPIAIARCGLRARTTLSCAGNTAHIKTT